MIVLQVCYIILNTQNEIAEIKWTVYGKVQEVVRTQGSSKKNLKFEYNATGQRTAKHVYNNAWKREYSDYYVYDAQGNIMSIYRLSVDEQQQTAAYTLTERPMYGSSRLGVDKATFEFMGYTPPTNGLTNHILGLKQYSGSNHLGNVLTTFSDKKIPVDENNNGTIAYYNADVTSSTDYYPFGVTMKGRDFNSSTSRFGFNSMEKIEETETMDFGARLLDGDLGVWLALDPLMAKYTSISPYCFVANMVLIAKDIDGRDIVIVGTPEYQEQVTTYLFSLAVKSGKGAELVKNAIESGRTLVIVQTDGKISNGVKQGGGDGSYDVLFFNIDQTLKPLEDGLVSTTETSLAHEIDHFLNPMSSAAKLFDEKGNPLETGATEVSAVESENIVRKEMDLPIRKKYGDDEVYGKGAEKSKKYDNTYILKDKKDYAKPTNKTSVNFDISKVKQNKKEKRGTYKTDGIYIDVKGGGLDDKARQVKTQTRISSNEKKN